MFPENSSEEVNLTFDSISAGHAVSILHSVARRIHLLLTDLRLQPLKDIYAVNQYPQLRISRSRRFFTTSRFEFRPRLA
jgi:hypothetical protein